MFVLTCDIKIGDKRFTAVNEVTVKRSIYSLGATATVKLPVTAVLRSVEDEAKKSGENREDKPKPVVRVETAQAIAVGDRVEIRLGYDNRHRLEFRGYVKTIDLKTPLEIICEDEFWTCRRRNVTNGGTVALADLLKKCGLEVGYAETLTLRNFAVPDKPVSSVLSKLTKDYGLSVFFDLDGQVYACRPEKAVGDAVRYEFRRNVVDDDSLRYMNRAEVKMHIKAVCYKKDGTKVEAKKGVEGGTSKTLYFYDVENMQELAVLAGRELDRLTSDGYEGGITTFLGPYAAPGMLAELTDPMYPDRTGKYYIETVETTFGLQGGRRKVEIGMMAENE